MRTVPRVRIWVALMLIGLLVFSNSGKMVSAQQTPWIDQNAATRYVSNLITSYNAIVDSKQTLWSNFTAIKSNFPLYHEVGQNFKVLVVRDKPNSTDNIVGFAFEPIQSTSPVVIVSDNVTIQTFYTTPPITGGGQTYEQGYGPMFVTPYGNASFYVSSNYPQFARYIPLIWITNTTEVLTNTQQGSKGAADFLYAVSSNPPSTVGVFTITSTDELTYTRTTTSSSHSGGSPAISNWVSYLWWILGGVVVAAGILIAVVIGYFGSFREFVKVLGSREEQRKVLKEMDEAFRRNVKRGQPKESKQKPKEEKQKRKSEDDKSSGEGS